jgi:hypothetical protein
MSDEIPIRKGVPIPEAFAAFHITNPISIALRKMEPGDCFDLAPKVDAKANLRFKSDVYGKAKAAGIKIAARMIKEDGVAILRVWRTDGLPESRIQD